MADIGNLFWASIGRSMEDARFKWYDLAANNCFGVIDKKIDELSERMNTGNYLNNEEQYLLGKLQELKREIVDELRAGERDVEIL